MTVAAQDPARDPAGRVRSYGADVLLALTGVVLVALEVLVVSTNRTLGAAGSRHHEGSASVALGVAAVLFAAALAAVVVHARPDNPVGWLLLLGVVLGVVEEASAAYALVGLHVPGRSDAGAARWAVLSESLQRTEFGVPVALLLVFPTGRALSRRWRAALIAVAVWFPLWTVVHALRPEPLEEEPFAGLANPWGQRWLRGGALHYGFLPVAGALGIVAVSSLVVRYRRADGEQRQQLRWVAVALGLVPAGLVLLFAGGIGLGPGVMRAGGDLAWLGLALALPAALAVAMTKYRLYDLDLLLQRTLLYTVLSAIVLATYAATVLVVAALLSDAGWSSPALVAPATLAAAFVAMPARRRVQELLDRTFSRRAWAAHRVLTDAVERARRFGTSPMEVEGLLARLMRDPGLRLALWLASTGGYVAVTGRPFVADPARRTVAMDVGTQPVARLEVDAGAERDRRLVETVSREALLLVDNARLQLEVQARLEEVRASRARLLQASDDGRRRVERDLHDGAQQRIVGLALEATLAARSLEPSARGVVLHLVEELQQVNRELRELASGLHPAVLEQGLEAALCSVLVRLPVPVTLRLPHRRLSAEVELAAYYVACEAVTNAVKHAGASRIELRGDVVEGRLELAVRDDGSGGADLARGSGLRGLEDRVAALGGELVVDSPPTRGTTVTMRLPCGS